MSLEHKGPKIAGRDPSGAAQRNRYFPGKLLTVADYALEQNYQIERRRLINRLLHGWGVISGFAVAAKDGALQISPGMALDPQGRELVACTETLLERESDLLWLGGDARGLEPADERAGKAPAVYLLSAHYAERPIDGVRIDDGCGGSVCEANRVCETVVFSLTRRLSSGDGEAAADGGAPAAGSDEAGVEFDPFRMGSLSSLGGLKVDLRARVPLAAVTVGFGPSGAPDFSGVDASSPPRRHLGSGEVRTGGGLEDRHVRIPVPEPIRPTPDEAFKIERLTGENERLAGEIERLTGLIKAQKDLDSRKAEQDAAAREASEKERLAALKKVREELEARKAEQDSAARQAGEAEAALRAEGKAVAEAKKRADSSKKAAADAEDKLRQGTQSRQQADADLAALKAGAEAFDKLRQATQAHREAEAGLAARKAEAKAAADAQQRLVEATRAVGDAEANLANLRKEFEDAHNDLQQASAAGPFEAPEKMAHARARIGQLSGAFGESQKEVARLKAEEAAAGAEARKRPAVTPEAVATAEKKIEAAKKEEEKLKAAAKDVTPQMIEAAEARMAAARAEADDARNKAGAAKEEMRLRDEASGAAETKRDAARADWERLAGENERLTGLVRELEERIAGLERVPPGPAAKAT